jgi:hypothetical protein
LTSGIPGDFPQRNLPYRRIPVKKTWRQRRTLRPEPKRDPSGRWKAMLGEPRNARAAQNLVKIAMRTGDGLRPLCSGRENEQRQTEVAFVVDFRADAEDILCADRLTMPLRLSKSRL